MTPKYDLPVLFPPWPVPRAGFAWVKGGSNPDFKTKWLLAPADDSADELTDPASTDPVLYRVFAEAEPKADGFLAFANRYGALGVTLDALGRHPGPWEPGARLALEADHAPVIGLDASEMGLLDAAVDEYPMAEIARLAYRAAEQIELYKRRYADPLSTWEREHRRLAAAVRMFDQVRKGTATPAQAVAVRLAANLALGEMETDLVLARARATDTVALHVRPRSLLGLMWLQFALAITGGREHRKCEGCEHWFEVSAEYAHGNRDYCGETCKKRAYRKRKATAVELAAGGMKPKQIAETLGSDVATVKGWIGQRAKSTASRPTGTSARGPSRPGKQSR